MTESEHHRSRARLNRESLRGLHGLHRRRLNRESLGYRGILRCRAIRPRRRSPHRRNRRNRRTLLMREPR